MYEPDPTESEADWPENNPEPSTLTLKTTLAVVALALAIIDFYGLLTEGVDLNKHVPLLYPVVLLLGLKAVCFAEAYGRKLKPAQKAKLRRLARNDAYTHPKNRREPQEQEVA